MEFDEEFDITDTAPPGEEGAFHSNAGGEHTFQKIYAEIQNEYVNWSPAGIVFLC